MEITILMEDSEVNTGLLYEHGFSVFVKRKNLSVLIDSGASDKTWENANMLGIDIRAVNQLFLSL